MEIGGSALEAEEEPGGTTEIIGVVVAAVVLIVTLGSVVAAGLSLLTAFVGVVIAFCLVAALAVLTLTLTGTAAAAPPENTTRPTLNGAAREGTTLTASRGTWANSPTSYAYTWQRCATDGT